MLFCTFGLLRHLRLTRMNERCTNMQHLPLPDVWSTQSNPILTRIHLMYVPNYKPCHTPLLIKDRFPIKKRDPIKVPIPYNWFHVDSIHAYMHYLLLRFQK
jgi:hypothetical protein